MRKKSKPVLKGFTDDGYTTYTCGYLHDTYNNLKKVETHYTSEESEARIRIKEKFEKGQRV